MAVERRERRKKKEKKSMIIVVPSCLKDADGARTRSDQKLETPCDPVEIRCKPSFVVMD